MTKQILNPGATVDDFSGDYLRQGALKIINNFNDIYQNLGDESLLHPAGRWQTFDDNHDDWPVLTVKTGEQWSIDTTAGGVSVNLPETTSDDINCVIKLRDTYSTWSTNAVTVTAHGSDTINAGVDVTGNTSEVYTASYTDLAYTYCDSGKWIYVPNTKITGIDDGDSTAGVIFKEFVANGDCIIFSTGQGVWYNKNSVQVYRNGALLNIAAYTSADINGDAVPLNGTNIRLVEKPDLDDIITVISYSKSIGVPTSAYSRYSIRILDSSIVTDNSVVGSFYVGDLTTLNSIPLSALDSTAVTLNSHSAQVYLNGHLLIPQGKAGFVDKEEYNIDLDTANDGADAKIEFDLASPGFAHGDELTVIWFNNEIGSTVPWNGTDSILSRGNETWLNVQTLVTRTNKKTFIDRTLSGDALTNQSNVQSAPSDTNIKLDTLSKFFDSMYPIGTKYTNTINPANPATYMGFGIWKEYAQGQSVFGYDAGDVKFDTPGVSLGSSTVALTSSNIPELTSTEEYAKLNISEDGTVNITGCLTEDDSLVSASLDSEHVVINKNASPDEVNILPPYKVAYKWVRVG